MFLANGWRLDYDPEDLDRGNQDSDEEAGEKDASAGREHYQDVGLVLSSFLWLCFVTGLVLEVGCFGC